MAVLYARSLLLLAVLLGSWLAWPSRVQAIDPPATVKVGPVFIYRHVLESNDYLLLSYYNINYGSVPGTAMNEVFIARLLNGTTQLAAIRPFPYFNSQKGYGQGIVSMYFSNATFTSLGMAWQGAYTLYLEMMPEVYPPTTVPTPTPTATPGNWRDSLPLATSDYDTSSNQDGARSAIQQRLVTWLKALEVAHTVTLTTSGGGVTAADAAGTTYLSGAIPGITTMVPTLFATRTELVNPTPYPTASGTPYSVSVQQKIVGTPNNPWNAPFNSGGLLSRDLKANFFAVSVAIVVTLFVGLLTAPLVGFLVGGLLSIVLLSLMGVSTLNLVAFIAFIIAALFVYKYFLEQGA